MHLITVEAARKLQGEPLKAHSWEVVIPNPPPALVPLILGLSLRARNASIPGVSNRTFMSRFGPFVFNHVGQKDYPRDMTLRFEEGYAFSVLQIVTLWNELMFSENTATGLSEEDLIADMWVRLLATDESQHPVNAIHLHSVFPRQLPDSPLAYDSADLVFLEVSFAYDYWRYEPWPF